MPALQFATPLLLCLVCVELSDVVFAFDSVPAVFGVTQGALTPPPLPLAPPCSRPHTAVTRCTHPPTYLTHPSTLHPHPRSDPLVVYSSNIFAIAGLRSLFGVLSKAVSQLEYLEKAVGLVLGVISAKLAAEAFDVEILTPLQRCRGDT